MSLPSESDFHEAVESIPLSINPTLPLESEVSTSHILFTASSDLTEQGGIEFTSDQPPPSSRIGSFDWDSLVEPRLPSNAPFQIKVKVEPYMIAHCIVDEGASVSIFLLVLGEAWDLPALCRMLVSYWHLIEELVQIWEFFLKNLLLCVGRPS